MEVIKIKTIKRRNRNNKIKIRNKKLLVEIINKKRKYKISVYKNNSSLYYIMKPKEPVDVINLNLKDLECILINLMELEQKILLGANQK